MADNVLLKQNHRLKCRNTSCHISMGFLSSGLWCQVCDDSILESILALLFKLL